MLLKLRFTNFHVHQGKRTSFCLIIIYKLNQFQFTFKNFPFILLILVYNLSEKYNIN